MNKTGKIVKIISNLYTVEVDNERYDCRARGKFRNEKQTPLVGDFALIDTESNYMLKLMPRKNELSRPPIANVDVAILVTSVKEPNLSLTLLDKELLCVYKEGIEPIICLTKTDLLGSKEKKSIKKIMNYYSSIGIKVLTNKNLWRLKKYMRDKTVVLTGQTGAGKSTLLNKLDRRLNLNTSPISAALGRGVHTTRHVELFDVKGSLIADTPGFSALDINIDKNEIKNYYPEFKGIKCKFEDCMHDKETGCGVKKLVEEEKISEERYNNYLKFRGVK